jgi:Ca2+-binding EF-hand superfamily protein
MAGWGDVAFGGAAPARELGGADGIVSSARGVQRLPGAGVARGGTWDTGYTQQLGDAGSARSSAASAGSAGSFGSAGSAGSLSARLDAGASSGAYHGSGLPYAPASYYAPATQYHAPANQYHAPANQYHAPANQYHAPANQSYAPASQDLGSANQEFASGGQDLAPASQDYAPASQYYAPASESHAPAPSHASGAADPGSARERSAYGDGGKDSGDGKAATGARSGSARTTSASYSGSAPAPGGSARSKQDSYSGGSLQHSFQDRAAELLPVCRKFHLHARHVREFEALFKELDVNKSGTVERAELFTLLREPLTLFSDAIFDLAQCSSEGGLRLSDFIEALSTFALLGKEDILRFCFFALDRDKSGFLDHRELHLLCELLHGRPGERVPNIELVLAGFDRDRDGRISFPEFAKINNRFPLLLWPAFRLQARIEEATMGRDWWYRHRRHLAVERRREKEDSAAAARADATALKAAYGSVAGSASRAASRASSASRQRSGAQTSSSASFSAAASSSRPLARQVAAAGQGGDAAADAVRSLSAIASEGSGSRALSDDFVKAWAAWQRVGSNRVFPDWPGTAPEPVHDGGESGLARGLDERSGRATATTEATRDYN